MESVDLAMDDIFDGGLAEEDLAIPPPLPDLDDDMPVGGEDGGALNTSGQDTEAANTDETPKSAVKKRVLRPQPKLDSERLQSERGLPMLPKLFSNTKFKGKGHEVDDLKLVMGRLEHWAHRLFPKLTFDDFTARLEKLGRTKAVQTCIKRIRLDMPIAGEDFTGNPNNNEDGSGNEDNDAGGGTDVAQDSTMDVEEAYEEMLRQERQQIAQLKTTTPGGTAGNHPLTSAADSSSLESSPRQLPDGTPSKSAGAASPTRSSTGLSPQNTPYTTTAGLQISMTPEQLARIERNKQLAVQKRAARLGVPVSSLLSPKPAMKVTRETSEGDAVTPTVTASTPLCHQPVSDIAITTVAVTTDVDMNTHVSDSCDGGAQAGDKEGKMSDKDHAVIENTGVQDRAINKCTTDGTTMQTEEEILDALESDHNDDCPDASVAKDDSCVDTSVAKDDSCVDTSVAKDDSCVDTSVAKDDSCVDTSVEHISGQTKSAKNGTSEKNSSDLQTSAGAAEVVR